MKWAVLASNEVGHGVLGVFRDLGVPVEALVLDPSDLGGFNASMEGLGLHHQLRRVGRTWSEADLAWIRGIEADWLLLDWWPFIVPEEVLGAARLGALNLHPSLLPHGAGRNPNFWTFVEGTPFGVSLHHATGKIDGGEVAFQHAIPLDWTDTGGTAHAKARAASLELFRAALPRIEAGEIPRLPQDPALRRYHRNGEMEAASRLDLDRPTTPREVLNLLRARTFPPHPAAWFEEDGRRYEVRITITEVP